MAYMETLPVAAEEELQVKDPATGLLASGGPAIAERAKLLGIDLIKEETHRCMVEITTGPGSCGMDLKKRLEQIREKVCWIAGSLGFCLDRGGSCGKSRWQDTELSHRADVKKLYDKLGKKLHSCVFFGLHIHVGITCRETAAFGAGRLVSFLPMLLALSACSRYFSGRDTGFESFRARRLLKLPATGIPAPFRDYAGYRKNVDALVKLGVVESPVDVRWDVRLHPVFQTVEVRIMDCPENADDSAALAILIRAILAGACRDFQDGVPFDKWTKKQINSRRNAACRHGMNAELEYDGIVAKPLQLASAVMERFGGFLTGQERSFMAEWLGFRRRGTSYIFGGGLR